MIDLTRAICRSANRIYLAVQFSTASDCPEETYRTVREAARIGQDLLVRVDPFWLRTSYTAVEAGVARDVTTDAVFQATVGDLLQRVRVHQIPIARLGSTLCNWDGTYIPFEQLGDALDSLDFIVNREPESVCDLLLEHSKSDSMLHSFSDAFYGLAIVIAAIHSPTGYLRGLQREVASAAAKVVLDSSKDLSDNIELENASKR